MAILILTSVPSSSLLSSELLSELSLLDVEPLVLIRVGRRMSFLPTDIALPSASLQTITQGCEHGPRKNPYGTGQEIIRRRF